MKVLFVDTGNAGRSPAAEFLAAQFVNASNLSVALRSRGTGAAAESKVDWHLARLLPALACHQPRPLRRIDIDWADVILVMATDHASKILKLVPGAVSKVHLLCNFVDGEDKDVSDPERFPLDKYGRFLDGLDMLVRRAMQRLVPDDRINIVEPVKSGRRGRPLRTLASPVVKTARKTRRTAD